MSVSSSDSLRTTNDHSIATARASLAVERTLIKKVYQKIGCPAIQIVLWDDFAVGDAATAVGRIIIREPQVLRSLLLHTELAFGEAYSRNGADIDGDMIATLTAVNLGMQQIDGSRSWIKLPLWRRNKHNLAASKASVHHHYDIGNDFYKLWLDRQLVYTCAYYPHESASLEEAQTAKLDLVCRKLRLRPGERVVEAGCGWGALALHMARQYGVTVRAFNLSREQIAFARASAQTQGLADQVEFVEDDYRNISGQYDVFVSVGMLEHVGPENYKGMGELMNRVLPAHGRGLIHSIGRNAARPLDAWTTKYIFPGAYAPSLREMMDLFEEGGFSVLDVENLRRHYARTCADWLANFNRAADQVQAMFDEKFVRMWRLYLAASSAAFTSGDLQLFQVVFARLNHNLLPMTRDDWYR